MSLYSDWLDLSQESLQKNGLSLEGSQSGGLKRAPIYFRESVQGWEFPDQKRAYLNILPYSLESFKDEFAADDNSAVLFSEKNYQKKNSFKNIFFQPSLKLGEIKKVCLSQCETPVDLGIDPYSLALWKGELCSTGHILSEIDKERPGLKVFRLSTMAYDLAGATSAQQLAALLSATHQLIKDYDQSCSVEKILSMISYEVSLSNHFFINIAKLQSLRQLLMSFYEALGVKGINSPDIYAIPSPRYLATREPWNNILRLTTMGFSARAGGAQGFFSLAFDLLSNSQGQRMSRNNDLVLDQESFVGKVNNPSAGGGLSEDLLTQHCHRAWTFFQEMEKKQGLVSVLRSGWLQDEIELAHEKERQSFLKRENKMIGVNEFALTQSLSEDFPLVRSEDKKDVAEWWIDYVDSEGFKRLSDVQRLKPFQLSCEFEKWQFLADRYKEKHGQALKVSLFCENPKTMKEKLSRAKGLMAAAGIEVQVIVNEDQDVDKVALFVAADPEGNPVVEALKEFKSKNCSYSIWVGERSQTHFDDYIGNSRDLMDVYEKIFKAHGVKL